MLVGLGICSNYLPKALVNTSISVFTPITLISVCSAKFWSAVHDTLAGNGSAAENLEILELDLEDVKGSEW